MGINVEIKGLQDFIVVCEEELEELKKDLTILEIQKKKEEKAKEEKANETFILAGVNVSRMGEHRVVIRNTKKLRDFLNRYDTKDYVFLNPDGWITWEDQLDSSHRYPRGVGTQLTKTILAKKSDWGID